MLQSQAQLPRSRSLLELPGSIQPLTGTLLRPDDAAHFHVGVADHRTERPKNLGAAARDLIRGQSAARRDEQIAIFPPDQGGLGFEQIGTKGRKNAANVGKHVTPDDVIRVP